MKKIFRNLILATAVVTIACSFSPAPSNTSNVLPLIEDSPVGGAYLVFAGQRGGEVSVNDFKGQQELQVDGCAKGSKIFKYSLHITSNGKTTVMKANSNKLTDDMIGKLAGLSKGDEFVFKNMQAYLPNGKDVVDVHGWKYVIV